MKTISILTMILGLGLLTNCEQKKDDPEILKKILTDYFDGIKTQDLEKLNSLTTSDFVLFEDGVIWTNDSLVTMKEKFSSFKGAWKFDNISVNIDESSGDIVYFNQGDFVFNDTIKMKIDWLESATFRKVVSVRLSTYFLLKKVFLALRQKDETSLYRKSEAKVCPGL